jgi:sugar/nucleoside kinase (ribokinase family)
MGGRECRRAALYHDGMNSPGELKGNRVLFAGRTTVDALYWLDELPREDTKVFARAFRIAPGGPACNAAITHAALDGRATLLSAVGRGPWAELVRRELKRHGIALIDLAAGTDYETPLTTVLASASTSSRTIVNPPMAKCDMTAIPDKWDAAWGEAPRVALTDGFHLRETLPLFRTLATSGTALVLDGGSWKPGTEELAPLLTAAICSERFALPGAVAQPETTLKWFASQGVLYAAVTRGPRPILGLERGRRFEIAIEPVDVVDTLGAGDVLHGAFCRFFAETGEFESSLRKAAAVATRACCGLGIADWAEIAGPSTGEASGQN